MNVDGLDDLFKFEYSRDIDKSLFDIFRVVLDIFMFHLIMEHRGDASEIKEAIISTWKQLVISGLENQVENLDEPYRGMIERLFTANDPGSRTQQEWFDEAMRVGERRVRQILYPRDRKEAKE